MSKPSIAASMAGAIAASVVAAGPALAHPGSHHGMSFAELAQHLTSGWHLLMFGAAAAVIGVAAIIVSQRRQARAQYGARKPEGRP